MFVYIYILSTLSRSAVEHCVLEKTCHYISDNNFSKSCPFAVLFRTFDVQSAD